MSFNLKAKMRHIYSRELQIINNRKTFLTLDDFKMTKKGFKKRHVKDIKTFLKKRKTKNENTAVNNINFYK